MKETLCWSCKNATGGCPWAHDKKEVEGWKAKPTITEYIEDVPVESYAISECPLYIEDYRKISVGKLIQLAGFSRKYSRHGVDIGFKKLRDLVAAKGYDLVMYTEGRTFPEFYIKKFSEKIIEDAEEVGK